MPGSRRPPPGAALFLLALALAAAVPPCCRAQVAAAYNTALTADDCIADWQRALEEGNCSATYCGTNCIDSLGTVPIACLSSQVVYDTLNGQELIDQLSLDLQACGFRVYVGNGSTPFNTATNVATVAKYIIGICVGAVAMSIVFIILMAAPTWFSKVVGAPTLLVVKGKRALNKGEKAMADAGRQAAAKGREAYQESKEGHWKEAMDALRGKSSRTSAAGPPPAPADEAAGGPASAGAAKSAAALPVEAAVTAAAGAARSAAAAGEQDGPGAEASAAGAAVERAAPSARLRLVTTTAEGTARTANITWTLLAGGLYIAALVLLILGTIQFVYNTLAGQSLSTSGNTSALAAIEWLIIGGLIMVGVVDIFIFWIVMAANMPNFYIGHWTIKNRLYSKWIERNAYRIQVSVAGLMVLVLTIACVLFGLGMLVVTIQLVVQLACASLESLSIRGLQLSNLCIDVPTATNDNSDIKSICGYQALQVCHDYQSMAVLMLVVGAALLLWSHIIWLVLLLLNMWKYMDLSVKVAPSASGSQASLADEERGSLGGTWGVGGSHGDLAEASGGDAAKPSGGSNGEGGVRQRRAWFGNLPGEQGGEGGGPPVGLDAAAKDEV